MTEPEKDGRVSRRVVSHAAAWTIPVIAVAVTAPVASASGGPNPVIPVEQAEWSSSVSITKAAPRVYLNRLGGSVIGYEVYDDNGNPYPPGSYIAETVYVEISWGPAYHAAQITGTPGSLNLTVGDLNGWVLESGSTAAGVSGTALYKYTGLTNGTTILQPRFTWSATTGTVLPPNYIQSRQYSGSFFGPDSGVKTP